MVLHRALSWRGVRQHFFRIGKTADILPTRLHATGGHTTTPAAIATLRHYLCRIAAMFTAPSVRGSLASLQGS